MLSVIIPVYNAIKYLPATIESIITQNYRQFEIILVDDGSKDGSGRLCDTLAEKFQQITVIHKINGGVSSARNAGIDAARGKYLTFIDADDEIDKNMFSELLLECESKNIDKVFCGLDEVLENGTHIIHSGNLPSRKLLNRNDVINTMLLSGCLGDSFMNSVCGGIYKTELIRKHNLRFKDRPMGEDWYFNMQYCDIIESALYIDQPYYKYLRNGDSAMSCFHSQQFELWLENREFRRRMSTKYNFEINLNETDSKWVTKVLFYAIQVIKHDFSPNNKLKQIFGHKEFVKALRNATNIKPHFFKPVVWLLKKEYFLIAVAILKLYSYRVE